MLLSGWGTETPIEDFMPLINELSKNFRTVAIEYFGYGESNITEDKRSNKIMTKEIREALNNLNIRPPYIFMPHSMSGLYSLYYANNYPDEVSAIIGIDASLPKKQLERWTEKTFNQTKLSKDSSEFNISIINQWNEFYANSTELEQAKYPKNLPVLLFLASEQVESVNEMIKSGEMKTSWIDINKNVITNPDMQFIKVLNGEHYLHHNQTKNITEITKKFIETYIDNKLK